MSFVMDRLSSTKHRFYANNGLEPRRLPPRSGDLAIVENYNDKIKRKMNKALIAKGWGSGLRRTENNYRMFARFVMKEIKKVTRNTISNRAYLKNLLASEARRKRECIANRGGAVAS